MSRGFVGLLSVDLHLPDAASLKDKRRELRRVKAGLASRFAAAVAEVDDHGRWQRATVSAAVVAREAGEARRRVDEALRWLEGDPVAQVIGRTRGVLALDDVA